MFVDRTKIKLAAGKGGNGVVAWRREKYIPKGGPYGGNGGRGGDVVVRADTQISSLEWFRHRRSLKAEHGQQGGANLRQGRSGENLELKVPCGTLIKDMHTGEVLHDLTEDGQKIVLCAGGKGGRGNASFKTPTRQAPNFSTLGRDGGEAEVELELKLIADVGLVGFPNAGKSTLVNALTFTSVKIGAYPFTTLHPNLGYLKIAKGDDAYYRKILIADIPGIIEGAHENRGLGIEFLRHIERTRVLVFVLDASGVDGRTPADDYRVLQDELGKYREDLLARPKLVLLNKVDTEEAAENVAAFHEAYPDLEVRCVSALEGEGLGDVVSDLHREMLATEPAPEVEIEPEMDVDAAAEQDEMTPELEPQLSET